MKLFPYFLCGSGPTQPNGKKLNWGRSNAIFSRLFCSLFPVLLLIMMLLQLRLKFQTTKEVFSIERAKQRMQPLVPPVNKSGVMPICSWLTAVFSLLYSFQAYSAKTVFIMYKIKINQLLLQFYNHHLIQACSKISPI